MAGTITFSGLSSGLDTASWIESLVSVKSTTLTSLQEEQKAQQELLNVVNGIKSYFSSFQATLQKITDSQFGIPSMDLFMQNLATSSNTNIVTATATTEAARQSYDVLVDQLATSTKATSGQKDSVTQFATLDTTLGTLGVQTGTITVNSKSFNISENDTIKSLIEKFSNVGVVASFNQKKSTFTVNTAVSNINDGGTGLKNALKLQDTNVSGVISGSLVYATSDTELYKLGVTAGDIKIEGATHTITKSGTNYTIQKQGTSTSTTINTLGQFLSYLKSTNVNAEEASIDTQGNITIRGAVIESVSGGSNIKEALNLGDVEERTIMESQNLTFQKGHAADFTTTLADIGITSTKTLVIDGASNNLGTTTTLQTVKDLLNAKGVDMSIDSDGVIEIDTNGVEISGTLIDALGLEVTKGGTTLTSNAHTVTYKATGDTLLSELGVTSAMAYTAYKSDGTQVGVINNNNQNITINDFINQLKGFGLNASFDENTQQIKIDDGYITGTLATQLGMTSKTDYYQEAATISTTLEDLGAVANQTLIIDGSTKTYNKTTTLNTVIQDIKTAGGTVEFKDGIMNVSGVTLGGTLAGLLGFEATGQGTSITSGALSIITNSSSTGTGGVEESVDNNITMSSKIGDITGTTSNYTLSINGGTSQTITKDSTLQSISNLITAQGGTFKINDDNTISIEGVKLSGSLLTALGLSAIGQGTEMTSGTAITVGGVENVATAENTLKDLGVTTNKSLSINATNKTYANTTKISTILADIQAAGGSAKIENGIISVQGVTLSGDIVDILNLSPTISGTTISSGNLTVVTKTTSTSSGELTPISNVVASMTTKLSDIPNIGTPTLTINDGVSKTYQLTDTLATIKADIEAAGGSMRIDSDGKIYIEGVSLSGSLVNSLGLKETGTKTEISSNTAITYIPSGYSTTISSNGSIESGVETPVTSNTYIDYIINNGQFVSSPSSSNYTYTLYDSYGNKITGTAYSGTYSKSGGNNVATIGTFINAINSSLNSYYGTSGVNYATLEGNSLKITGGYITGNIANSLGLTTSSSVSGIKLTSTEIEYNKFKGFVSAVDTQYENVSLQKLSNFSALTPGAVYGIYDAQDLVKLSELVNAKNSTSGITFVLKNDIDMSGISFDPIGNDNGAFFQGNFYGGGHTISNASINASKDFNLKDSGTGLFGSIGYAVVKDVRLENVSINITGISSTTAHGLGTLVGNSYESTISNCVVDGGNISYNNQNFSSLRLSIGGLVGAVRNSNISDIYVDVDINTQTLTTKTSLIYAGGVVGIIGWRETAYDLADVSTFNNIQVDTNITINEAKNAVVGGFAAFNAGRDVKISNAYISGDVTANNISNTAQLGGVLAAAQGGKYTSIYSYISPHTTSVSNLKQGSFYAIPITYSPTFSLCYVKNTISDDQTVETTGLTKATNVYLEDKIHHYTTSNPTSSYHPTELYRMGLHSDESRTLNVSVGGVTHTKTFDRFDTLEDVINYLNNIPGVNASYSNSNYQFTVSSNTDTNLYLSGGLADVLLPEYTSTNINKTENNSKTLTYNKRSNITTSTKIGELLGSVDGGSLKLTVNGTQINFSYSSTDTIQDVIDDLGTYGVTASLSSSGEFTATSEENVSISGNVARALLGNQGSITHTQKTNANTVTATGSTTIDSVLNGGTASTNPNSSDFTYNLYASDGTLILSDSTNGSYSLSGGKNTATFNNWVSAINSKLNSYYGTSGVEYAKMNGSNLSISGGYVTGNLADALNLTTNTTSDMVITSSNIQASGLTFIHSTSYVGAPYILPVSSVSDFSQYNIYYYSISSKEDLISLAEKVNSGISTQGATFILNQDIDMSGVNFTPIGTSSNPFQGTLNANGNIIKNVSITSAPNNTAGIFGVIQNARIDDLGVENINISITPSSTSYVGGLVGRISGTSYINNCYVNNGYFSISSGSTFSGNMYAGGLVGELDSASRINYSFSDSVTIEQYNNNTSRGMNVIGGLVGNNLGTIYQSYANNNIYLSSYGTMVYDTIFLGGFVGSNNGTISDSYSKSNVSGMVGANNLALGGFVGYNTNSITSSYAMGVVGGRTNYGAFYGSTSYALDNSCVYDSSMHGSVNQGSVQAKTSSWIESNMPNHEKYKMKTAELRSTLESITSKAENSITIKKSGQTYTKTFYSGSTLEDLIYYLNYSVGGVNASYSGNQLKIEVYDSAGISFEGELFDTLLKNSSSSSTSSYANATKTIGYVKLAETTKVSELIGTGKGGSINLMVDGVQYNLSYDKDDTLNDVINDLAYYGVNAEVSADGVFSVNSDKNISMQGDLAKALLGDNFTVENTPNEYVSNGINNQITLPLTNTTVLENLGIKDGTINILDADGNFLSSINIDSSKTLDQIKSTLSAYGFTLSLDTANKKVTISSNTPNKLVDGSSNFVSALKLDTWTATTGKLTTATTLEQLGFSSGSTLNLLLDGTTQMNFDFGAKNSIQDIINSLNAVGITASVDANGKFTATSNSHSFVFSGDLASALTKGSTGYQNNIKGYESHTALTYKSNKQNITANSTVADLLKSNAGGTLRVVIGESQVINLDYDSTDSVQTIMDDLAALGINMSISNGVISATSYDKTFTLAGNIGNILQGNNPTYTNFDSEFISQDLSYQKTNVINNNSILANIGITNGQVYVVDTNGNVINSIDVDNSMTIEQITNTLKPYGFNMSVDASGKVSISSADGYSLIDGSSNMISKFKLTNWNQTSSKLTTNSTLAEMGFKDGAELNMILDGTETKSISFSANDTLQNIINSLQTLGINVAINNTNGALTISSKEHSFIFTGDLGNYLTSGSTGYVNTDKKYVTDEPLIVDLPYVNSSSSSLKYTNKLSMDDTVASMGFEDGGVIRLTVDGNTQYSLSFLETDTLQDIADTFAVYGIELNVDADGKVSFRSDDHTFALGGALGNYLMQGGAYNNIDTGYISDPIRFNTTENIDENTKLSSLGVSSGYLNILDGSDILTSGILIDENTTIGQLFSAIKVYGIDGSIVTKPTGETYIKLSSDGQIKLADGTSDVVQKLGLANINQGDYDSQIIHWDTGVTSGLITEDMLLSDFDKNGFIAEGSLFFTTGNGPDQTQHIINISSTETVGSLLEKLQKEGVNAVIQDGVIRIDNGVDGFAITGGTSGIQDTLNLVTTNVDKYATSSSSLTYQEDVITSVANFADGNTKLSTVNIKDGELSLYVDGVKATVNVNSNDSFEVLFDKIVVEVAAKTGKTIEAGFLDTDGNIVKNPTADKNTGIIAFKMVGGEKLVIGASNDKTNFATIANLTQKSESNIEGSRALYKVNINSLITEAGLFKAGNITEGSFTIGDATFTIDSTTTLNSLIKQINASDKAYASAYWDSLSGTLVLQSTLTGESLINIESGDSNFTDIMGFTETVNGVESLVTSAQTLGKNAIVRINGTTVTSSSNIITSDISKIKGLTINLKGLSKGESTTITVEQDDDSIYNAVLDIIDSYNTLIEGLEKELSGSTDLAHDTMLKLIKNNLKRLVTSSLAGSYVYKNLAAVGITTGEASNDISTDVAALVIDKEKFMQALEDDSDSVKILLSGTTDKPGILLQMGKIVDNALSSSGYIGTTENRINKNISNLQDKIEAQSAALIKYRQKLEAKFGLMESIIGKMQHSYVNFLSN